MEKMEIGKRENVKYQDICISKIYKQNQQTFLKFIHI